MDVRCEKCGTEYEFDENRIGANGVTVKCTAYGFVFKVRRPRSPPPRATTTIGKGPQGGKEWLVRKPDGQMIAFRELTTLQKWIVEGRIGRDDEISKNGETWKRLGNIMELEPFFSVYEKARTLNTLMDQSAVELRGSEVLSAANPIPQPQPLQSVPTIPASYSSASLPTAPVPAVRGTMPIPPSISTSMPIPLTPRDGLLPGNGMGTPIGQPVKSESTADLPRPRSSNHHRPQPAAIPDLSIPIDDNPASTSKSDIVARFERSQRKKAFAWIAAFVVTAGAGGAIAFAIYGPANNPLKAVAIEHGLLAARPPPDDGAMRMVEEAQSSADLDTLPSLQKAASLLEKAASLRESDPVISAQRALVLIAQAGSYRRWSKDLELAAAAAEKQKQDPKPLRASAEEKAKLADPLLVEALTIATVAEQRAPEALEPARAMAAYHLVQDDPIAFATAIARAKAGMEKVGRVDPATLYLEAIAELKDPSSPAQEGLEPAKGLLEQALTARPTMNAARVLLARIHLANETPAEAKAELDRVLAAAPAHEEAKRLKELAASLEKALVEKKAAEKKAPPPPAEKTADPNGAPPDHPDTFEWWMSRADSLRERDRTRAALDAYGRAAELKPFAAEPHTGKGWCFLDIDRPHLALASFDRAINANSRYVMAYYGRAESFRALGETDKAIAAFEEYLSRAPSGPDRATAERTLERLKGGQK
jgi:predicted Zn finger-like uncharacterized protein